VEIMIEQKFLQEIVATTSNYDNPDSLVRKIAKDGSIITYIYHLNGNLKEGSLLNQLRRDQKNKDYELVAFAIINHILNEDGKSPEETNIKQHQETLIEFLLLMNNERPNLIEDVLSSLEENTNHIPTYLFILNKAIESNNVSVTVFQSIKNDKIIEAIRKNLDPIDHTYYDDKIDHFTRENTVLQELLDTLYQKVAEQKRKTAEESRKAAAAKLLQASIRRLKPRKAEQERKAARKVKEAAEEARKAEQERKTAEESRKAAEQERKAARKVKEAAERARKVKEAAERARKA